MQIRYQTEGGVPYSYGYDRRGNLTEERRNGSLIRQYTYDAADWMVLGKHFAYARVYDSAQGRMCAKDPVKRGMNGYPYCDNDPADYVDPDGELAHVAVATFGGAVFGGVSGFIGSAISQRKNGEKFSLRKALGAAAEGAVKAGTKGALLASGFGATTVFAGDFASGTIGNMLNRAISGERQNLGESVWGGLTNAVSGRASGYGKIKGVTDAFKRGALNGAATSVMNDIHDMAGIGDAGRRAYGGSGYDTGGFSADIRFGRREPVKEREEQPKEPV